MKHPTLPFDFTTPPEGKAPEPPPVRPPLENAEPRALTVSELDRAIRERLEEGFARSVWVEGEVVSARAATSGHAYFSLKDEREEASIDCVVYRSNLTPRTRALLRDGARVRLRGRPTFWAPRGRLQLVADRAIPAGRGALLEALERLKEKLAAEGLFAPERKRALPREPRTVGVVTSESGAAIHDICKVAFRRGSARVLLAPAQVQGSGAAESVARALVWLQRVRDVDVIIVGRGGGSSDDLAAFNDEALVRTVAACRVPVISAVGHEVDVTLVDFVADARAATPSQAAEMAVPDAEARRTAFGHVRRRLVRAIGARLAAQRAGLVSASRRLADPRLAIAASQQSLDDRNARLEKAWARRAREARAEVVRQGGRLARLHPSVRIGAEKAATTELGSRLVITVRRALSERDKRLGGLAGRLDAMSPLKVLGRGYAIATRADGVAVRDATDVAAGDPIRIRVRSAHIDARVTQVEVEPDASPGEGS